MGGSRFTSNASWMRAAATMAILALAFAAAFGLASAFGQAQANAGQLEATRLVPAQSLTGAQLEAQATASDMENSWGLKSIFAQDAQTIAAEKAKAADKPVCVAILDTGFYSKHEALKGKVVAEWNAAAIGEIDLTKIPEQRRDTYLKENISNYLKAAKGASVEPPAAIASELSEANHGIHVASIVRSVDPDANLILIRVADETGEMPMWALFNAFALINEYHDEFNIRVVNCSAGSAGEPTNTNSWEYLTLQQIGTAYKNGIITVASAGNDASTAFNFPSDCENVVGVMSLEYDSVDNPYAVHRLSTSNYNATNQTSKNICAPGAHIPGAVRTSSGTYSYELMSGTSMAAPHVAGVLALMMQADSSTYAANADGAGAAVKKLYDSATHLGTTNANGWSQAYGWGEVNAAAAVSDGGEIPDTTTSLENGTQTTFSMNCPNAQSPTYAWSILHGSGNAEFVGATNKEQATLWAVHDGQVIISCIGRASSSTGVGSAVFWACKRLTVSGGEISGPDTVVLDSAMPKSYQSDTANKQFAVAGASSTGGITWSSSNTNVLTVNSKGVVTGKAVGTAMLYAERGNAKLKKEVKVTTVDLTSVADLGYYAALYFETATYDGSAQKPAVKLYLVKSSWRTNLGNGSVDIESSSLSADRVKLSQGTDFAVTGYSNNVNAGKAAMVTIAGRGNYTGTKSYSFTIFPATLTASNVKLAQAKYTYNGKAHKPGVAVTSNGRALVQGSDYTVKWENYVAAGTAKVTVTGKGNYRGTATKTYTIAKAKNTLTVKAVARKAKAKNLKKKAQTLARPLSVTKAQGKLTFTKKSGNSKITVDKKTGKLKLARGLKKGTYKVKIQVHAAGTANYYGLSKQVTATVRVA